MDNSFRHNGHHQAISQKLKKAGTYSAKSSIYMESHIYNIIFINSFKIIDSLQMHYLQYDVSRLCCGGCEYI
jgi:glycerol-3-phosphate responsive antiterminator